jgi:hypothetical protein
MAPAGDAVRCRRVGEVCCTPTPPAAADTPTLLCPRPKAAPDGGKAEEAMI